jgi:hypothetical protein
MPPDCSPTSSTKPFHELAVVPRALRLPASMASYRLSSTAATRSRLSRGDEIARSTTVETNSRTLLPEKFATLSARVRPSTGEDLAGLQRTHAGIAGTLGTIRGIGHGGSKFGSEECKGERKRKTLANSAVDSNASRSVSRTRFPAGPRCKSVGFRVQRCRSEGGARRKSAPLEEHHTVQTRRLVSTNQPPCAF